MSLVQILLIVVLILMLGGGYYAPREYLGHISVSGLFVVILLILLVTGRI